MDSLCEWFTHHFTIQIIYNVSTNLVWQSLTTTNEIDYSKFISTISTFCQGWISAAFHCSAKRRAPVSSTSSLRRRSCASWSSSLVSICSHDYLLYLCITIRGQYHLTIQVKFGCPTDWVVLRNRWPYAAWMLSPTRTVGRDADSVASSHSAPIRVQYCLYSESGLFWAI